jgi:uncharacterized MAPEG superfamily protein
MPIAYWCVLIAGLMPVLTVGSAKFGRRYDNHNPRTWLDKLDGWRKRADSAHKNHFEAFPFFAAGVIIAQQMHVAQGTIDLLAMTFIASRIVYTLLYLYDLAMMRTLSWVVGYGCVIALFVRASQVG